MTEEIVRTSTGRREHALLDLPDAITVGDLADMMKVGAVEVVKGLMRGGYMFSVNDVIEYEIAAIVAQIFGFQARPVGESVTPATSLTVNTDGEDPADLQTRAPVVTVLGHVDHGKTTLLDNIRDTNVVDDESGGITQHIGAYQTIFNDTPITFLDTPGHEAFTAMRVRGAQITDIAIVVIAAADGLMPQTIEAIDHARAANVPIIVAITKKDVPGADIERVNRQLSEQNLLIEEWGGETIAVPLSGITGEGVEQLLESVILVAEISELRANPKRKAKGVVVEARRDKSRGSIATVLVQTGTLRKGDIVVLGEIHGRIRAMFDYNGNQIATAGPSTPAEIMGIDDVPEAGSIFGIADDEKSARQAIDVFRKTIKNNDTASLQDVHIRAQLGEIRSVNLIIKTDVQGTIEAIRNILNDLNTDDTKVNIIHIASGSITERDILLAVASDAIVIGFNSGPEGGAESLAKQEGIEIRSYKIIYQLADDIKNALDGMLQPTLEEVFTGRASVRATFNIGKHGKIAGIYVNDGTIGRGSSIHVLRNGDEIFVGPISTLRHFNDDVREVSNGFEAGLTIDGFDGFEEDDVLEAYIKTEV